MIIKFLLYILDYNMYSKELKKLAKDLRNEGKSYVEIGNILKINQHAARGLIRYKNKVHICKRGPKLKLGSKHQLQIKRQISSMIENKEKVTSLKIIRKCDLTVSKHTVHRYLRRTDFVYKKSALEINLSKVHKQERIRIISKWVSKNLPWENVVFSDEKRFSMDGPDNWMSFTKKSAKLVREKRQCGGGGVNIWMMVLPNGLLAFRVLQGNFCSQKYITMLQEIVVPLLKLNFRDDFYFQQDNSSIHRSKVVQRFFEESSIKLIEWPAKSPDLNIVEDLWKEISDRVYDGPQFYRKEDLIVKIKSVINQINTEGNGIIQNLYSGMRSRLAKVLVLKGNLFNK